MASGQTNFSKVLAMGVMIWLTLAVAPASAQCGLSLPDLVAKCEQFVMGGGPKVPPSAECCGAVKGANVPCVCSLVTPSLEKLVNVEKVVYVARTCGLTVPAGMKCGSYTVPPQ
ncbi:PREDICTED: uncharacterized protein LOC104800444 [Tarenaya hassleriana]|uniref:uncharacterized protein LOC104800444 n=1 Tax=Tarenaya hassleriana TaxID=28532 RepID=UPI00053C34D4|nr:PREDICTED: uncharacterized protein LOC104800444 [Tarenaya hassleriana]